MEKISKFIIYKISNELFEASTSYILLYTLQRQCQAVKVLTNTNLIVFRFHRIKYFKYKTMKNYINKYQEFIEVFISIVGLVLTSITLYHNIHIYNVIVSFETFQVEYHNAKIDSLELALFFIPMKYRKAVVHFYHRHFCKLAWCNFLFFLGGTIYTNILLEQHLLHHIGYVAALETLVLLLEKNPTQKLHKLIDFIISLFK